MFNLMTLTRAIEKIGKAMPNVNTVVLSNIYQLNELPDIDYSVFCITQDIHRQDDEYFYFNYVLYYVDRLLNDKSNQLEIQSTGIQFLSNVLNKVEDLGLIINTDFQTSYQSFTQRFADECAGCYCNVAIQVPIDCSIPYDILVDPLLGDLSVALAGTYYPKDYGCDAFKEVTVEGTLPDIWVKKDPALLECEIGNPVDMNNLTESGYYFIRAHNIQITNFIQFNSWCPDLIVNVISKEFADEGTGRNEKKIVQVATTEVADFNESGNIYWPRRWYRVYTWKTGETFDWCEWQEIATNENAVMKYPHTIHGSSANTIDFNDITKSGYYFIRANWGWSVNGPLEHIMDGVLEVIGGNSVNGLQRYTTQWFGATRTWIRYYSWSGWGKWVEVTTDDKVEMLTVSSANTINLNHYSGYTKNYFVKVANSEDYLINAPVKDDGFLEVISRSDENDVLQRYTTTWTDRVHTYMRTYGYDPTMQKNHWNNWYEYTLTEMEGTDITQAGDHIVPDPQIGGEWDDPDPHAQPNSNGIGAKCLYTDVLEDNEGAHLWTIQDAKDGDVLVGNEDGVILMFRGIGNTEWDDVIDYHCYYDCHREDLIIQEDVEYWGNIENNKLKPATKEQCDLLFQKMKELGYEWDAEKKELKKQKNKSNKETIKPLKAYLEKQKPVEWSEEDDPDPHAQPIGD